MRIDIFFYLLLVLISFLVCFFFLLLFFIFFHLSPSLLSSIALVTSSLLASKLRFSIITLSIFLIRIALRLFPTSSSFLFSSSCFPCLFCFLFYLRYSTFLLSRNRVVSHKLSRGNSKISIFRRIFHSSYRLLAKLFHRHFHICQLTYLTSWIIKIEKQSLSNFSSNSIVIRDSSSQNLPYAYIWRSSILLENRHCLYNGLATNDSR